MIAATALVEGLPLLTADREIRLVAELQQAHGTHVPSPIQISDHVGYDTPRETILKEILILTKMNWNSSRLGGLFPITMKFSRLVGEIMREIGPDREPLPQMKYYV